MFRRTARVLFVLAACGGATSMASVSEAEYQPPMALYGQFGTPIPLKNAAMVQTTPGGYRYIAGQQDSNLTITQVGGDLVFTDTGTKELRDIPSSCTPLSAGTGIAVKCAIPDGYDTSHRMYVEVWPRLGNDVVDGSTLSPMFRMWVLADAGRDTVFGGAGDDFVNGAQNRDTVWGGAGNDWLRTGKGRDELHGGDGDDKLVGTYRADVMDGGAGNDQVSGGSGNDTLTGGPGADVVSCGSGGADDAFVDAADRVSGCESVSGS